MTNTAPRVYAAIAAITADIGKIAKDGRGPSAQGSFPFMPVESIIEKLNPLTQQYGLVLREHVLAVVRETDVAVKATPDGTPVHDGRVPTIRVRVEQKIQWDWVHIEDGSTFSVVNYGEAHDVADKAIRKANTAAYKEMLLRTFSIVAGENDPDSIDPNAEAEAVAERRSRGQQRIEKARPAAGRTTARREAPKVPAPEPEESAAPEPERAAEATSAPAAQPAPTPVDPAGQQDATWKPDPEDVAYAEGKAPAPKATPGSRPAAAHATPETKEEVRGQNISQLKNDLRRAWTARGLNRDDVNALGRKLTGKEPTEFLFNITDLNRIMSAVEAGEVA